MSEVRQPRRRGRRVRHGDRETERIFIERSLMTNISMLADFKIETILMIMTSQNIISVHSDTYIVQRRISLRHQWHAKADHGLRGRIPQLQVLLCDLEESMESGFLILRADELDVERVRITVQPLALARQRAGECASESRKVRKKRELGMLGIDIEIVRHAILVKQRCFHLDDRRGGGYYLG